MATPGGAAHGKTVFGKNSDRPAGEAQPLRRRGARPSSGAPVRLSHVEIEDAAAFAHLGSAPFWCGGYESGVNEHRVAIGNEAVFSRSLREAVLASERGDEPEYGILGMELVRLGLERAATAQEAVTVITGLLERYGQWGSGKFGEHAVTGAYDNSFLIADPGEAWILETSGREWAARRAGDVDSISNELSIRTDATIVSAGARESAQTYGWPADRELDFAAAFIDPLVSRQVSHIRRARSSELLERSRAAGGVDLTAMRAMLRDHLEGTFLGGPSFDASKPDFLTLCMHEAPSGFTWGNTASSLIAELPADPDELDVVWWAAVTPCTTAYIPLFPTAGIPLDLTVPAERPAARPADYVQERFDPASHWWRAQRVLDSARGSDRFAQVQHALRERLSPVEAQLDARVLELADQWRSRVGDATLGAQASRITTDAIASIDRAAAAALSSCGVTEWVDPRWA